MEEPKDTDKTGQLVLRVDDLYHTEDIMSHQACLKEQ
jgi:hypothetical protein